MYIVDVDSTISIRNSIKNHVWNCVNKNPSMKRKTTYRLKSQNRCSRSDTVERKEREQSLRCETFSGILAQSMLLLTLRSTFRMPENADAFRMQKCVSNDTPVIPLHVPRIAADRRSP